MGIVLIMSACGKDRQVVPYDVDIDEIYKALVPNDEDRPDYITFGHDSIPGFIYDIEFDTDNREVYVYFDNLTVLDVNPQINQNIFEFIQGELCEYGFINDSVNLAADEFQQLIGKGFSFTEAAGKLLDTLNDEFTAQLKREGNISYPFNARFDIYPVYISGEILTYRLSAYCYTGGAHGMTISYLRSFNLDSGKLLDFDDIVNPESRQAVREEIAAHMAYSYPIYENITTVNQYIDSLNVWLDNSNPDDSSGEITASNFPVSDVALTEQGLVAVYQMYELTPGSDGCPVVLIPYSDLKGCLNINLEPDSNLDTDKV